MSIPKYFISMSERLYFVEVVQRVQSVKVVVIRSPAEARTPLCALLRMLRLAGMTGIVGCSERAPDGARVVPFAARARGAGGAATKVVVRTAAHISLSVAGLLGDVYYGSLVQ